MKLAILTLLIPLTANAALCELWICRERNTPVENCEHKKSVKKFIGSLEELTGDELAAIVTNHGLEYPKGSLFYECNPKVKKK